MPRIKVKVAFRYEAESVYDIDEKFFAEAKEREEEGKAETKENLDFYFEADGKITDWAMTWERLEE